MRKILPLVIMAVFAISLKSFSQDPIYHFQLDGKDYEVIKIQKTFAEASTYSVNRGGYLVELNDSAEAVGIYDAIINGAAVPIDYTASPDGGSIAYVWIGATDGATEGNWIWDGNNDGDGTLFWTGEGSLGANDGAVVDNAFVNWGGKSQGTYKEPDDYANQDAAAIALEGWPNGSGNFGIAGEWNDISITNNMYFVIEYDGNYGVNEKNKTITTSISPNPATDFVEIKSEQKIQSYEIINLAGATILKKNIKNYNRVKININSLPSGIYLIKTSFGNNKSSYNRLIIE